MGSSRPPLPHIAVFPFMSKGHVIPLLHLAHLLHRRRLATLTFFTTPLNAPFLLTSLAGTDAAVVPLPFPQNLPSLPPGVESTDNLPSISLFLPFIHAVKLLRPHFEKLLSELEPKFSFLISDGFLGWTADSASELNIPRIVFYGMGQFAMTTSAIVARDRPHVGIESRAQPFEIPGFPNLRLTRSDLNPPFDDPNPTGPLQEFVSEQAEATGRSYGIIVNSFYELEAKYLDRWNSDIGPKSWFIGPVCLGRPKPSAPPEVMKWLDSRLELGRPVLYVAFGTQVVVPADQLEEIAAGLVGSGLDFLWVVRGVEGFGFEFGFGERGRVVREWVDQLEILRHGSIRGFMSHCGWNSVLESVCGGVPILAWPMIAEQHLNAKFVVEEVGIGVRIGGREGLVGREEIGELARELVVGEKGEVARGKVRELAVAAEKAMMEGGSSVAALESMIEEMVNR